jgi:hypothetical protein
MENTACIVDEACLLLSCLITDVLLLSAILCCGGMFTGPLPSNGMIRHNTFVAANIVQYSLPHKTFFNRQSLIVGTQKMTKTQLWSHHYYHYAIEVQAFF